MNRRAFFSFLPAAPFGVLMAAEAMSVGKDGHLWLKINDEWKRIVTE
jgi:hypothetical protein